ncbi:MAG: sulfite exporter TauE/SafE family protein [Deltaproteobacteria bacterium]|nr:sulfite exporter TauE/SafE family protein [Deltaproteobacteria bacterium]
MSIPDLAPWQWIVGATVAVLVGIAKTGVPGVGTLAVPLMVLTVGDARHSAGWLLPLLCVADLFAVAIYRRHAYARRLFVLLPWVLGGMIAGAVALYAPERVMRPTVAVIVLIMIAVRWRSTAGKTAQPASPEPDSWRLSALYGGAAGFSTTIANAAGPVMNLYLLAKRLPKDEFVGTGAWFFLMVNLCKLPLYVGHDLIDARSLGFDAVLIPAVVAGAGLGRVVLRNLRQETFERLVFALTVVACAMLFIPK